MPYEKDNIMDAIFRACVDKAKARLKEFDDKIKEKVWMTRDKDLLVPWLQIEEAAKKAAAAGYMLPNLQLDAIKAHTLAVHDKFWKKMRDEAVRDIEMAKMPFGHKKVATVNTPMRTPTKNREIVTVETAAPSQNTQRQRASIAFARRPEEMIGQPFCFGDWSLSRVKASYAYFACYEGPAPKDGRDADKSAKFAFDVAMRELCAIKAESNRGEWKTIVSDFYSQMKMFTIQST